MQCARCHAENREGRRFCAEWGDRKWPPRPSARSQAGPPLDTGEGAWRGGTSPSDLSRQFPGRILGELCDLPIPPGVPVHHLARLLRWPRYERRLRGAPPALATTYVLEALTPAHAAYLGKRSETLAPLRLEDPAGAVDDEALRRLHVLAAGLRPLWLVVHAGPMAEIGELLAYAAELARAEAAVPRVVLVAPEPPPDLDPRVVHLAAYPAAPLFPLADRIITACGFNVMRETEAYRMAHRFLPFPRPLDDQFRRASRRRRATRA